MGKKLSIVVAAIAILFSLVYLTAYIIDTYWYPDSISMLWISVGMFYLYSLLFFIVPSIVLWFIILLLSANRIINNPTLFFSAKLFAVTVIFNLAAYFAVIVHSNIVEITVANYSKHKVDELKIKGRRNKEFTITNLAPGVEEVFLCYCANIQYPNDTGIKLSFRINNKDIDGYIVGRYSPIRNREIEIRILNDSLVFQSYASKSKNEWVDFARYTSPVLTWEEIVKEK
ncbi:hypothetical protein WG947_00625 [Pontibacter sp. H259]|uniref:hypothetical protein n=1 Tax=Pontibacter sp. H259 TaxID=3133421 RepID=UPI0030C0B018